MSCQDRYEAQRKNGNLVLYGVVYRSDLGHENRKTTEIYLHTIGDLVHNAMEAFERAKEKSHTDSHSAQKIKEAHS